MTGIQTWAVSLYASGAVLAVWGAWLAASRIIDRYRDVKDSYTGSAADFHDSVSRHTVQTKAREDMVWGVLEFVFVAAGVVFGAIASIMLVVESSVLS